MNALRPATSTLRLCTRAPAPTRRAAHTAAIDPDRDRDNAQAGPSRPRIRHDSDYRFPRTGRRGGPPDPYEVMALTRGASAADIKAKYYKLALILHPDSSHPSASAEHFATLNRAYKLLSSPASRASYLQTGTGWSGTPADGGARPEPSADHWMREAVHRAKRNGAGQYDAHGWGKAGFRASEAGSGAWKRYGDASDWYTFEEANLNQGGTGSGDPRYMSNNKFVIVVAALMGIGLWVQLSRVGKVTDSTREHLVDRHVHAANALDEARREALIHGKARREHIRRRVNELKTIEACEAGGGEHGIVPVSNGPGDKSRPQGQ
ncbi:Chaperone protein DnaJ [Vanrija pseudolonga]|uniref:Chaperone protein DnaJ n=1 Tax=Vanrija pseudolonga TaxID=143232 RepID=A0AAF1BLX9_9TREE|nr:Chaperone protein DnaJ [Vanrija pseudolonga]